jgi:hypothetical protein
MAGKLSTLTINEQLDAIFGNSNFAPTLYFGLSTTVSAVGGTNITEPTDDTYARVAVTNNANNFPNATGRTKTIHALVSFPAATAEITGVMEVVVFDAAEGGNYIGAFEVTGAPKTIPAGSEAYFAADSLTISRA